MRRECSGASVAACGPQYVWIRLSARAGMRCDACFYSRSTTLNERKILTTRSWLDTRKADSHIQEVEVVRSEDLIVSYYRVDLEMRTRLAAWELLDLAFRPFSRPGPPASARTL
jgi:hypothetical protein